jgi:phosphoglycolate phosphatase
MPLDYVIAGRFTEPLLKSLGIYDDFAIVVSGDSVPKKKPDPLPLLHAAHVLGVAPEDALMIGDSINDVEAARAAGFRIVALWV